MSSSDRIDPALAADIDRLATTFAKNPRSRAFMPLAESYIKAGMWQEAAAVLEDGLSIYPGFVTAMAALGRVYDQLSQPVKAKAILEEVIKQSPDNLRAHRILAKIFAGEGNVESAMKSCAAILAVNPRDEAALSIQRDLAGGAGGKADIKEKRDVTATVPREEPERHSGHAGAGS
ncbi:MAG TPA: tetratricopeptide repeat protein, partial [Nitrospiraceae bacterium]|nr:tetratricopeptide repeat protein [Nitrospiraceae bacterium]